MTQVQFGTGDSVEQMMRFNRDIQKRLQEFYFGDNPVSDALSELSAEDLGAFYNALSASPSRMIELQMRWWQGQMDVYKNFIERSWGAAAGSVVEDIPGDRRFSNPLWKDDPNFDLLRQSYILFSKTLHDMIDVVEGIPDSVRHRLHFFTRQTVNALSPGNFFWTNPEVLQITREEDGANLVRGMEYFSKDLKNSGQYLQVRMMKEHAFTVGKDLAYTEGSVVYKNDIIELIHYKPRTAKVFKTPLLIVPPFINKYYILDLREKNSFVRWLADQGHSVFLISWRNPTEEQRDVKFDDLVVRGAGQAVKVIEDITGEKEVNAIGYCIGGTVLASLQAYYVGKRLKNRIKSATYMTTILDSSEPGELGVFINEPVIGAVEAMEQQTGYCDGRMLSVTFSLLRENSLYWNYYIENYLKGREPSEFDILYWNGDGTNVSPAVHSFILRTLYLNNDLIQEGKVKVDGTGLYLSRVKSPSFFVSCQADHIALWGGTFKGAAALGGEHTLVLSESGHVAGIVNPPEKKKYGYYTNTAAFENKEQWLEGADYHTESWWLYWAKWILPFAGEEIDPYPAGNENYPVLYPAPGEYVKVTLA